MVSFCFWVGFVGLLFQETGAFVQTSVVRPQKVFVVLAQKEDKKDPIDNKDPIEKLFSFFFGAVEESPMGLKRMSVETMPDQYPAEKRRRALAVAGDDDLCAKWVRPTLAQTSLESRGLRLAYRATEDGWRPEAFHEKVDRQGPCAILCLAGDETFGGYAPKGFVGLGEYRPGLSAFLFCWNNDDLLKLQKVGGAGLANVDNPEQGPFFGSEGLVVPMLPASPRRCRVKLGPFYERMPDGAKSFLKNQKPDVLLDDLLVYVGQYKPDENVPFDDAIPFSLT